MGEVGPVFVKSGKQKIVTKSSTEAELVGLSDTASPALHLRHWLAAQGYAMGPVIIYQDNMSCMALIKRVSPASERSRHIGIRHFWLNARQSSTEPPETDHTARSDAAVVPPAQSAADLPESGVPEDESGHARQAQPSDPADELPPRPLTTTHDDDAAEDDVPHAISVLRRGRRAGSRDVGVDSLQSLQATHPRLLLTTDPGLEKDFVFKISVRSALRDRETEARPAIMAELQQMVDKRVWHGVKVSSLSPGQRRSIIRSSMFLKDKYLATSIFDRLKARLVPLITHRVHYYCPRCRRDRRHGAPTLAR
jgi:hypothetical protein